MDTCRSCVHCKFDDLWGEYKCLKRGHRIYIPSQLIDCEFYEKDKDRKGGNENE